MPEQNIGTASPAEEQVAAAEKAKKEKDIKIAKRVINFRKFMVLATAFFALSILFKDYENRALRNRAAKQRFAREADEITKHPRGALALGQAQYVLVHSGVKKARVYPAVAPFRQYNSARADIRDVPEGTIGKVSRVWENGVDKSREMAAEISLPEENGGSKKYFAVLPLSALENYRLEDHQGPGFEPFRVKKAVLKYDPAVAQKSGKGTEQGLERPRKAFFFSGGEPIPWGTEAVISSTGAVGNPIKVSFPSIERDKDQDIVSLEVYRGFLKDAKQTYDLVGMRNGKGVINSDIKALVSVHEKDGDGGKEIGYRDIPRGTPVTFLRLDGEDKKDSLTQKYIVRLPRMKDLPADKQYSAVVSILDLSPSKEEMPKASLKQNKEEKVEKEDSVKKAPEESEGQKSNKKRYIIVVPPSRPVIKASMKGGLVP